MITRLSKTVDPLVRLLLLAILLASFVPVTGEGKAIARLVSDVAVFSLFLLNGLRLPRAQVVRGLGNARYLLPLIAWCFLGMGVMGWAMARSGETILPEPVALGFLFLGVLPSTVQSATAYTSLAGGNIATSVVAAAVINMLGVFVCAPLLSVLAGSDVFSIDLGGLHRIALILILPFAIGQLLQTRFGDAVAQNKKLLTWMDRCAIAIAVYVAFSGAIEQGLWGLLGTPGWVALTVMTAIFLLFGFAGAWVLGGALKLAREERISFLFAGAQKSIAMGAPFAAVLFPPATAALVLLPVLAYHLIQLVISALLANRFTQQTA